MYCFHQFIKFGAFFKSHRELYAVFTLTENYKSKGR